MQIKNSEVVILLVVSLMAFLANLPEGAIGHLVDRNLLLIALVAIVIISLFRYLKLMLFITVSVLVIGANLPDQLANQLGISHLALILALTALVLISSLYKLYESGLLDKSTSSPQENYIIKHDTVNSRNHVITAILNGNAAALHQLLISGVEVNFSQHGSIPIFVAIEKGYADVVLLLLIHGAKLRIKNKEGKTPIEFALLQREGRIAALIHYASRLDLSAQSNAAPMIQHKSKMVVLFADICGSTTLYSLLGDEAALRVISHTLNVLIQEVAAHKGSLIKTIGDEIMCSFSSISAATRAASAMHLAIDAQQPGGEHAVHVRIGYHYGEVIRKGNDIFGDTVNIAARVTSITRARQTLTTQTVIDSLPSGHTDKIRPILRTDFKGNQNTIAIFEILWEPEWASWDRIGRTTLRKPDESKISSYAATN